MYKLSEALQVGAGAFTDLGEGPDASSVELDFVGGTAGLRWARSIGLAKRKRPLLLSTTVAVRYAYGWGRAQTLRSRPGEGLDVLLEQRVADASAHETSLYLGGGVEF